ncbi:MAG: KpsF/GutQ family sugar-phosphate isomerase [Deltaproteobacteria bacterium]|nr:MAG: KpsF/GutQ family sugar-phosphate isomerase [Deltaproteobacteria bacterium]
MKGTGNEQRGRLQNRSTPASSQPPSQPEQAQATLESARRVLDIEAEAIARCAEKLDERFVRAVEFVLDCRGRVVVTGMGKSGLICRKIAATLASTGTSALFLHAAEAIHGDLGMFARGDLCLAVSNSGTTRELLALLPAIKRLQLPLIAITAHPQSPLAEAADVVLDLALAREACPLDLAPTASTTATLALGDALAVAVLERRGFSERDFALLHPGGALGRKLLRVRDVMHTDSGVPVIGPDRSAREALEVMTKGGLGVVAVVDEAGALVGVITDGDVRRGVLRFDGFADRRVSEVMTPNPKCVDGSALAAEALARMEEHAITSLFIVDEQTSRPLGIVHMHDLLKAGIA